MVTYWPGKYEDDEIWKNINHCWIITCIKSVCYFPTSALLRFYMGKIICRRWDLIFVYFRNYNFFSGINSRRWTANKMASKTHSYHICFHFYTINSVIKIIFKFPTSAEQYFLYRNDFLQTLGYKKLFL